MSIVHPGGSPAHHPVVMRELAAQASDVQLRAADRITRFAGSMPFVYAHVVAFAVWMLVLERSPWPTLTLIVSLEAIFLSAFVMIGQNRQAEFQRRKADHDFLAQEVELHVNTQLTRTIDELVRQIHGVVVPPPIGPGQGGSGPGGSGPGGSGPMVPTGGTVAPCPSGSERGSVEA